MNEPQQVTGGCCQWRGSATYDSEVNVETVVPRRKFSDEPPNSTPPERYQQGEEKAATQKMTAVMV